MPFILTVNTFKFPGYKCKKSPLSRAVAIVLLEQNHLYFFICCGIRYSYRKGTDFSVKMRKCFLVGDTCSNHIHDYINNHRIT